MAFCVGDGCKAVVGRGGVADGDDDAFALAITSRHVSLSLSSSSSLSLFSSPHPVLSFSAHAMHS